MSEKILFNDNWVFHKGDINYNLPTDKGPIYNQSKTERMKWGPACINYRAVPDDYAPMVEHRTERWDWVTLPHDYVIQQAPNKNENNALGYFKYENAWYRKEFMLSDEDKNKRITLFFEAIATEAHIYVNGCVMKHNYCGYNSFEVDISDVVKFGEKNVVAVYVYTQNHEGWWYEGGGIYRNVWLVKSELISIDLWGVYVCPKKLDECCWQTDIETEVRNDTYNNSHVTVTNIVLDDDKEICRMSESAEIPLCGTGKIKTSAIVDNPNLWDIENPHMYYVITTVECNGVVCDKNKTRFGFREFVLDPDKGLFLNGKHVKIKGVCAHQDFGLTGKAVPDNILRHKVKMIKEMGANGYRCSHYPHPEATMDALDEMGFIVMDEVRWFDSSEDGIKQLEMLIKRDRNRPSVLFWSIGNEEPHHDTEEGRRICKKMTAHVKKLDSSRFVMTAVSNSPEIAPVYDELDAIGINYNLDKYEELHKKYPNKAIFASECCATGTTRGWYFDDNEEKAYLEAYDKDTSNWFKGREKTWQFFMSHDWIMGGYQWIAFEHRGECMWPRLCSQSGAIDLFLQKKDAFYQNMSHWVENRPVVHILPHWNFEGMEGEIIRVSVYTNCDEVELVLNGKSIGRKKVEKYGHAEWNVSYVPGKITAIAYNNGVKQAEDVRETSGKSVALKLICENEVNKANGVDIALFTCICVDENGREVPTASPYVSFSANKYGKVVGTGSDIADHTPVYLTERKMRAGRISVAVRVGTEPGDLKLYAESDGLKTAVATVTLV